MAGAKSVIRLRDVSVCYRLANHRISSFKEWMIQLVRRNLQHRDLWALSQIDIELEPGDRLGVLGRNGAGKSTLLKVIGGVLRPTTGSVEVEGRLVPLLALGTGFDAELTGLENIYLNALLLGRRRAEIDERVPEIVAFSGLEDFIHAPIRNYSAGMIARLGFSVATAWRPDIILIDEVLAVGDAGFRQRCLDRLEELCERRCTVVLVSHSDNQLLEACDRGLWLDHGLCLADGPIEEVVGAYQEAQLRPAPEETGLESEAADRQ